MRFRTKILLVAIASVVAPASAGALTIDGPTSEWQAVMYPGVAPDPGDDHQTGLAEADLVGNEDLAALYTQYDAGSLADTSDDELAFRLRLGAEQNPPGYSQVALVGMDADLDGSVDLFITVDNTGRDSIALYTTGDNTNVSPSTTSTSITSFTWTETDGVNYDWSAVSLTNCSECSVIADLDLDVDGENDFFLSFSVPFDAIVAVLELDGIFGVTPETQVSYVIGTSTNANAYNQDLGGLDGAPDPAQTWETLGALSNPTGINPIPEPGTAALLALGLCAFAAARRPRIR